MRFGRGSPGWCFSASRRGLGIRAWGLAAIKITFACLHFQADSLGLKTDLSIAWPGAGGCVTDAVLVAQLFLQLAVNLGDRSRVGNLEKCATGFARNALQRLSPVRTGIRTIVGIAIGKEDGINQCVGVLGGFDSAEKADFAAVVDAVGEQDERFSAWLFLQQLVLLKHVLGSQQHCVVECGAAESPKADL